MSSARGVGCPSFLGSPPVVLILVSNQPLGASPRFDFARPWATARRLMSEVQQNGGEPFFGVIPS
jgi:hypothetical protein